MEDRGTTKATAPTFRSTPPGVPRGLSRVSPLQSDWRSKRSRLTTGPYSLTTAVSNPAVVLVLSLLLYGRSELLPNAAHDRFFYTACDDRNAYMPSLDSCASAAAGAPTACMRSIISRCSRVRVS